MTPSQDRPSAVTLVAISAVALVFGCQLIFIAMHVVGWLPLDWHRSKVPYFVWGTVVVAAIVLFIFRSLNRSPPVLSVMLMITLAIAGAVLWRAYSHFVSFVEAV